MWIARDNRLSRYAVLWATALLGLAAVACGSAAGSSGNSADSTGESHVLSRTPTSIAEAPFDTGDFRDLSPLPEIADFGPEAKRELLPQPVGQTPLDVIPPIYDPQFVAPAESGLDDGELVMGVSINGESRAYPVGIMRFREVVNDDVGGVPVLVTWCPICFTGLVHDRRLEGTTYTFGNYGTLFMNAMTWWDHETESVWSQPWGAAIEGELSGARLTLLPYDLVPWSTWREQHPDTLALADGRKYIKFDEYSSREGFVIGVSIGNAAKGFYFRSLLNTGVINDSVGEYPIAVFADSVTRDIDVFIRTPRGESAEAIEAPGMLAFKINAAGEIRDEETGSLWDIKRGVALGGPLRGSILQRAPFITAFDWAWQDFNPNTTFWGTLEGAVPGGN